MSIYRQVNRASRSKTLDRATWAENTLVLVALEVEAPGRQEGQLVEFGTVFDGAPFFTYGVELFEGVTLVEGDFPFVTCGVTEWQTIIGDDPENPDTTYYTGATVWINVVCRTAYRLRFRLTFEGTAFKNVGMIGNG